VSGDVIVTVTLNAALYVSYQVTGPAVNGAAAPVSRPRYQAGGRGVTVARVLHAFGHDVLAAGLAGGTAGEQITRDLARSGVPAAFTGIRGESRRMLSFGSELSFAEPGPYITTEELGRFAAEYRRLLGGAAAVVLSGSLPDGLPEGMYASLVRYAAEAGVPAVLDSGGEELLLAVRNRSHLAVAEAGDGQGAAKHLLGLGAGAAVVLDGALVRAVTNGREWTARVTGAPAPAPAPALERTALVAGLVPGLLLGWSWPDRLRHAVALAAGGADAAGDVDLTAYEGLLDRVVIDPPH
jgi:tagatose 6-phosphate kinase